MRPNHRALTHPDIHRQATMSIHETAHQITVSGFLDDFGKNQAETENNKAVDENCRQLIEGIQSKQLPRAL